MSAGLETTATDTAPGFLSGGGEMAGLIAGFDWSRTSLGPISGWSAEVKTIVAMILRAPLPIVTLWGEPGVMIYNDAYSVFAGVRHPELLGSDVREGWPEVADFNDHIVKTVFRRGETLSYKDQELQLRRRERLETAWLDLDYSPVLDVGGVPLGVIAIVVDTTERVLADRQLRAERLRLRQMYEQSPSITALLEGPDHRIVLTNPAYQQLIGNRDVIGMTVAEALPEAIEQGYGEMLDHAFTSGQPFSAIGAKLAVVEADGTINERFLDFVYQPIRNDDGVVTGIFLDGIDATERVLAQQAIQSSEAQFRGLAEAMANHVWTSRPDGVLDWFNARVYEYSGSPSDSLVGADWTDIVHPDDLPVAASMWAAALASGDPYETEFRIRRADGTYRWHLVRGVAIRDPDGTIVRWIGTNTDIDDRKASETASARDRDRLWTMSQDLMLVCDFDGVITAVNPSAKRLLGWENEELVGTRIVGILHPDDLAAMRAEMLKVDEGQTTLAFESRFRRKDGGYRLLDWTAVPDDGRVHAVGRDITHERQLARDRERIWTLSPVVKVITASTGDILAVNPSWTVQLGWSVEATIGRNILEFVEADGLDAAAVRLERLQTASGVVESESVFMTREGDRRRFAWTTVPEGGTLYLFGRDITAETEAAAALASTEEALRQSQKMEAVGQLTGGIAHDFNNLLQGITGSLELIQRRVAQGRTTDLERFITGATNAANRAAALTHRLLAFSRRQPLDPRTVRANPLIASMEDLLRRTLGERVELELVLAGGLWPTLCDPNQLENAVLNLAINARDAMPEGGKLTIETCNAHLDSAYAAQLRDVVPGQYVCICVTDTGTGMTADTIARAFEPFFTTKPLGQGTGLGLSMIYGFARQSEGHAKIYSEAGQGTTFKLYLPRYRGPDEGPDDPAAAPATVQRAHGETVLVVEDEAVVRGLIVEVLAELGYGALEAADGPEGVAILQSNRQIDLLITDIGLPGLNGRQVADAGRARRPGLKVLFMTGYAENAALASGFLEPGMAMITKPFAMEALSTRIRDIIEPEGSAAK